LTNIFQLGWNHQPELIQVNGTASIQTSTLWPFVQKVLGISLDWVQLKKPA